MRQSGRRSLVGIMFVTVLLLTACQNQSPINREPHAGSTTASAVDGVQNVNLTVDNKYRFTPSTITVHRGKVRINLKHTGTGAPHDWSLQGFPAAYVPLISHGQSGSVEFMAPGPGSYTFVCTIHIKQGQTGTLVVLPG